MNALRPIHQSVMRSRVRQPRNMARCFMPADQREFIEAQALLIFTDMTNAGCSLQQTLAAVFLSGMNAAVHAMERP